ncbi:MAG: metallophosphoesterase [Candidatus Omnitrophica bacterium]|jgi:predicted phosphodiesterase|nr:metallophosphoesterase [Candidatus Omnitrophota bacterium]
MQKIKVLIISLFLIIFAICPAYAQENNFARPVIIMGDSQVNHEIHQKIVDQIIRENPVAVFQLGDQVNDGNDPEEWKIFNRITAGLRKIARYYPLLGNHDKNSQLYYDNFELPNNERWYSVKENRIRFIILDSNAKLAKDSEQYKWLVKKLVSPSLDTDFTLLLFHHALFTTSISHRADEKRLRKILMPLIKKYHVDAVFNGHCHNYERNYYANVYFIVSGGAGSRLWDQNRQSPYSQKFVKQYHYIKLINAGKKLEVLVINIDSNLMDRFAIKAKRR